MSSSPPRPTRVEPARRGVYGLALRGLDLPDWTVDAAGWPEVDVATTVVDEPVPRRGLHRRRGSFPLSSGGRVVLEREPLRITFRTPAALAADEVVHPHLAVAAAGLSYWLGRDPFHAGGIDGPDGAWMVAGRSGAGKSTLLAALAAAGGSVLCDDLVVVDAGTLYAGPRSVDLRPASAAGLEVGPGTVGARRGTRRRVALPEGPRQRPVAGWIDLEWGPAVSLRRLTDPGERLRRLAGRRTFLGRLPTGDALFDLVEKPGWVLRRPRRFAAVPATVAAVLDLTGAAPA